MISFAAARKLALSFPETDEHQHFDKPAFRVRKKIFATIHTKDNRMMLKLSLIDQSVFCGIDTKMIYPVPGTWGKQGATLIELKKMPAALFKEMMVKAYCNVAPAKLSALLSNSDKSIE